MITRLWSTVREQGWWVLIVALIIGAASWGFAEIADEVMEGESKDFDHAVMLALNGGPDWLTFMARDITALGGTIVLLLVTIAALGYLLLKRQLTAALFVFVSVAGGTLISTLLKHVFDRPRPDVVPHAVEVSSASFPSGHSMLAMVTYLTLGAVMAEVQPHRRMKIYLLLWAVCISLLVGVTRVHLGVHWPTDVLGGWCVGTAWALLCGSVAYWLKRRGMIEAGPKD